MGTPFLSGFSRAVVEALLEQGLVDVIPGRTEDVIAFVAERLASAGTGGSLISTLSAAVIACPHVIELFADDAGLKEVVQDLDSTPATWVRG